MNPIRPKWPEEGPSRMDRRVEVDLQDGGERQATPAHSAIDTYEE